MAGAFAFRSFSVLALAPPIGLVGALMLLFIERKAQLDAARLLCLRSLDRALRSTSA